MVSVLVVPILLLAAPGRAASHAPSGHQPGAAGTGGADRRSDPLAPSAGASASPTPRWADSLVVVADYRPPSSTTTTTAPPPPSPPPPAPVAHVAPVTTVPPTTVPPTTTATAPPPPAHEETGYASWYQAPAGTCASPDIAYGTVVTVTDLATGRSVTCTVDDRQASTTGRILDLAQSTFGQLADPSAGVIEVRASW